MIFSIFILIFSVYTIQKCSKSFDIAANYLTRNIGEGLKGPTINAIASSFPELLISSMFLFYFKDIEGFSAGYATIIGSSAFNIALIPVISFMYLYVKNGKEQIFHIDKIIVKQDSLFLLASVSILSLALFTGINIYLALLLIVFYLLYIFYIIKKRSQNKVQDDNNNIKYIESGNFFPSLFNVKLFRIFFGGKVNRITSILVIFISIFIIGLSCYLLVHATDKISNMLGVNLFFGAFIIAAIASSIPDTIFSIQDAKNEKFIDSFSNAYGSNIFDICIGLGLPLLIYTIIYAPIDIDMPIQRRGWLGNYILEGNLFAWSLLILFIFTSLVSLIYYKIGLKLKSALLILFLYILFIFALLIF